MTSRPENDLETVRDMLWKSLSESGADVRWNSHSPSELVINGIIDMDVMTEDVVEHFAAREAGPPTYTLKSIVHYDPRVRHDLEERVAQLQAELAARKAPLTVYEVLTDEPSKVTRNGLWLDENATNAYAAELGGWVRATLMDAQPEAPPQPSLDELAAAGRGVELTHLDDVTLLANLRSHYRPDDGEGGAE